MEEIGLVARELFVLVIAVVTRELQGDVTSCAAQQAVHHQRTTNSLVFAIAQRLVVAAVDDVFAQVATIFHNLGHHGCVELVVDMLIGVIVECG